MKVTLAGYDRIFIRSGATYGKNRTHIIKNFRLVVKYTEIYSRIIPSVWTGYRFRVRDVSKQRCGKEAIVEFAG
jgi:hypothetical protein